MTTIPGDIGTTAVFDFAGASISTFDFDDDADWYDVTLVEGFTYRFDLQVPVGNNQVFLEIFDDLGFRLDFVNFVGGTNSRSITADRTGTFFVAAREDEFAVGEQYAITGVDTDAQADRVAGAGTILAGQSVQFDIEQTRGPGADSGDNDWFAFDPVPQMSYSAILDGLDDNIIDLRGAAGNKLRTVTVLGDGPAVLDFTAPDADRFFIDVNGAVSANATYTLTLDDSDTISEGPGAPGTLAVGASLQGSIDNAVDRDWYAVALVQGTDYSFTLDGLGDNHLRLLDAAGNQVAEAIFIGPSQARIDVTADESATYFLEVDDRTDNANAFTLAAFETAIGPPGNRAPEPVPDSASLPSGAPGPIDVLANDTDPDGDALALAGVGAARNGTTAVQGGQVLYSPNPGFQGIDSFTYTVTDAPGAGATGFAAVTVGTPPSGAPPDGVIRNTDRADVLAIAQNATYLGGDGEDIYLISQAVKENAVSIVEDRGANRVQLVEGLEIVLSQALSGDLRLILSNGADLRILNADEMLFEVGGNATTGATGPVQDFDAFLAGTLGIGPGETQGGPLVVEAPAGTFLFDDPGDALIG